MSVRYPLQKESRPGITGLIRHSQKIDLSLFLQIAKLMSNRIFQIGLLLLLTLPLSNPVQATELSLGGQWSYSYSGSTVVLDIDTITNHASGGNSGSLRIELWAFGSPFTGYTQSGYQLATYQLPETLDGGFRYIDVSSGTVSYSRPPEGTWYIALLLYEWDGDWIYRHHILSDSDQTMVCSSTSCSIVTAQSTGASVDISVNRPSFVTSNTDTLTLSANISAGISSGVLTDIYLSVNLDLGSRFYLHPTLEWESSAEPAVSDFSLTDINAIDFYALPAELIPEGSLQFSMTLTEAGADPSSVSSRLAYSAATTRFRPMSELDQAMAFNPGIIPRPQVGVPFSFDFYPFASGGLPPYHFQLDTLGGFPPFGLVLAPNGILSGTPTTTGSVQFSVCAVDLAGNFDCGEVSITVGTTTSSNDGNNNSGSNTFYFSNWSCGTSSQCAASAGATQGTAGPFCSISDCNSWGNIFFPNRFSCSTSATNETPSASTLANGQCAVSGTDF